MDRNPESFSAARSRRTKYRVTRTWRDWHGQGFFWSKAVPGAEIDVLLVRGFAHSLDRPLTRQDAR